MQNCIPSLLECICGRRTSASPRGGAGEEETAVGRLRGTEAEARRGLEVEAWRGTGWRHVAGRAPPQASRPRRGGGARRGRRRPSGKEWPALPQLPPEQGMRRSRGGRAFFLSGGSRAAGPRRLPAIAGRRDPPFPQRPPNLRFVGGPPASWAAAAWRRPCQRRRTRPPRCRTPR